VEEDNGGGGVREGAAAEDGGFVRVGDSGAAEVGGVGRGGDWSVRWVGEARVRIAEVTLGGDVVCGDAVVLAAPATLGTVVVEMILAVVAVVVTEATAPSLVAVTARLLPPSAVVLNFSTSSIHLLATTGAWFLCHRVHSSRAAISSRSSVKSTFLFISILWILSSSCEAFCRFAAAIGLWHLRFLECA